MILGWTENVDSPCKQSETDWVKTLLGCVEKTTTLNWGISIFFGAKQWGCPLKMLAIKKMEAQSSKALFYLVQMTDKSAVLEKLIIRNESIINVQVFVSKAGEWSQKRNWQAMNRRIQKANIKEKKSIVTSVWEIYWRKKIFKVHNPIKDIDPYLPRYKRRVVPGVTGQRRGWRSLG